jgi:tellurite resistance protein TehA-like permease
MTIFALKYGLAVAAATALAAPGTLAALDAAVSGASAGYFLGWLARFALVYRRVARTELLPAPR